MSEAVVDDIVAVLPPLLQSLEALELYRALPQPAGFRPRDGNGRRAGRSPARRSAAA